MNDLIEKIKAKGNKLLESELESAKKWSKLKHNKECLELFLTYNVTELMFKPKQSDEYKSIICTSNKRLINLYSAVKDKERKIALATPFNGIHTDDQLSIMTYDLVDGKIKTIPIRAWMIKNFITLDEKNVPVLDVVIKECLKK